MVIFSLRDHFKSDQTIPDSSFFLEGNNGALCFLIHGLTGTPNEMGSIGRRLNRAGYSVAVPLMKNHNKPIAILKKTRWQDMYESLKKDLSVYGPRYQNIYVAGLSFGALLGLLLARDFPDKVKAVTCFSPTLFYDGWASPKVKMLLPLGYYTPLKYWFYFKEDHPYGLKNERLRSKVAEYYTKAGLNDYSKVHLYGYPVIPISCTYQNHLLAKYVMSMMGEVHTPIQLLQAKDDDVTSPKNSQYIYDHVASKDKELVFFEDSYHIIIADQERDKVAQKTVEFFDRHR